MDTSPIMNITDDIQYLVFQHLSGTDVKRAFQVSKKWFAHLNNSTAMKKIVLDVKQQTSDEIRMILESPRSYTNLVFNCSNDEIMTEFAESLFNLKVLQMNRAVEAVTWNKLQVLEIGPNIDPDLVDTLFGSLSQTQLQSLAISFISEGIKNYLKTHLSLKELSFLAPINIFMNQDVSFLCDLKLRKLKLGRLNEWDLEDDDGSFTKNLVELVTSQIASLRFFSMESDISAIIQLFWSMKQIKCLNICVCAWFPFETLPINTTIECAVESKNFHFPRTFFRSESLL